MITPMRGRVYMADLGHGEKPWLVVSNNGRNVRLQDFLVVRITTSAKSEVPSIVTLGDGDPLAGRVLCDDLTNMYLDEIKRDVGALSQQTMMHVAAALRHALAL